MVRFKGAIHTRRVNRRRKPYAHMMKTVKCEDHQDVRGGHLRRNPDFFYHSRDRHTVRQGLRRARRGLGGYESESESGSEGLSDEPKACCPFA